MQAGNCPISNHNVQTLEVTRVRRFIFAAIFLSDVNPGIEDIWRLSVAITLISTIVLVTGLTLGAVFPGAHSPLDTPMENSEGAHQNPSKLQSEDADSLLTDQIQSQLVRRAQQSAVNLSREDYEAAREQIGDDQFGELVDEYERLSGENNQVDESVTVARTQTALRNLTEAVARYWELYDIYERRADSGYRAETSDLIRLHLS